MKNLADFMMSPMSSEARMSNLFHKLYIFQLIFPSLSTDSMNYYHCCLLYEGTFFDLSERFFHSHSKRNHLKEVLLIMQDKLLRQVNWI
jgi:hypothetical protein